MAVFGDGNGEAMAATVNETDPTLEVRPQNTKGSAENIPLLEDGKPVALLWLEPAPVSA